VGVARGYAFEAGGGQRLAGELAARDTARGLGGSQFVQCGRHVYDSGLPVLCFLRESPIPIPTLPLKGKVKMALLILPSGGMR